MNRYRLSQFKLNIGEDISEISDKLIRLYGKSKTDKKMKVSDIKIVKHSIDARRKDNVYHVYTLDFSTNFRLKLPAPNDSMYQGVECGDLPMEDSPVIVGFGPCGMFAALVLAERGYKPVVVERGSSIEERVLKVDKFWTKGILNTECNVQFGEGGAGTFSDGKLTSGIKDPRKRKVLESFVEFGANPEIMYEQKPHIGTDILRSVVRNLRKRITNLGGKVLFDTRLEGIEITDGKVQGIEVFNGDKRNFIKTSNLILAIGHSARDTFCMLKDIGLEMEQKPFSIGVRIEHPQKVIDEGQYGDFARFTHSHGNRSEAEVLLPPAVYNLVHHCKNGRGVYTFCMCPGGEVIAAASEENGVVTNGMSYSRRNSGTANSGLLVDVRISDFGSDDVLAGVEFQRKYEKLAFSNSEGGYRPVEATWGDIKSENEKGMKLINSLPKFAIESMKEAMPHLGKKLKGFDSDKSVLKAVETRSSSPVRFLRNKELESNIKGLMPGGEGAGYAGGIMSSAVDGIKLAEKIISKYRNF
ncbi:MAG: NAD(FAD)-utilizing dehydrogenase [Hornefia sp.]|nr:NAD(FAD)-utilizing dehydrogenase [Hornefia sp.]